MTNEEEQQAYEVRLGVALTRLRRFERGVFLMAAADKLPYPEIARRMGISRKRVERIVARVLGKIRTSIAEMERQAASR